MSSDNTKKIILAVGAVAAVAGAAWFLTRQKEQEEPTIIRKPKPQEAQASPKSETSTPSPVASAPAAKPAPAAPVAAAAAPAKTSESSSDSMMGRQTTSALVNEYSFVGSDVVMDDNKGKVYQAPVADANGVIFFESLGVRVQLQRGWTASEETTPMPNVAMLTFSKPDYADRQTSGMPGEVPVVLMSIEDISNEDITVDEFREKSKMMALTQMQMMTNGMFQPSVKEDEKLSSPIGPFTHVLMYELQTPIFNMAVLNLTTVVDGLAYIFQVMANPTEFSSVRKEIVGMAKTMALSRHPSPANFTSVSSVTVTSLGGTASIPPAWSVDKANSSNPVFRFHTASTSRKESIEVYNASVASSIDLSKATAKSSKQVNGVTVTEYGSSMRVATKGDVVVVASPKHSSGIVTTPEVLSSIANSVDFTTKNDQDKFVYNSTPLKFGFEARQGSRIVESRLSERILVYAPCGLPTDPSATDDNPMLTVRVGDPSNDPDCRTSYDEWMARIRDETDGESISELKKDKIGGRECVTFVNTEMQEVGPNQKEERTAKVIIFLCGDRTTMLRWETPTGAWRKHENKLKAVLNSLRLQE